MNYNIVEADKEGVTEISLENIKKYADAGKVLEYVILEDEMPPKTIFVFKDHTAFQASGFAFGYGGEGPRGLHKAIRMFSEDIDEDFHKTAIPMLPKDRSWIWQPKRGFVHR